jgi:hypothetical protein
MASSAFFDVVDLLLFVTNAHSYKREKATTWKLDITWSAFGVLCFT